MKVYTFDEIFAGRLEELTERFIEDNSREPGALETVWLHTEARQYAKEFMENYVEWQIEQGHEERRIEQDNYGE